MDGGAAVVAAHGGLHLAQHQLGLGRVGAHHAQRPGALAVDAHALAEGIGDEEAQPRRRQRAHGPGVFGDAVAIALVGQVQVGQQLAPLQHRDQLRPLRAGEVHARRVVAARVQQHHAARGQAVQRGEHLVELQAAGGRVVVGVGVDRDPGAFEHGAVVVPGRVADPQRAARQPALDEIGAHFQAAAAAHRLQRGDAPAGDGLVGLAEQQVLHRGAHGARALDRQVGLRAALGQHPGFGLVHAVQHGDAAGVVEVDADGQVDLVRARVLLEGVVEAQDRVARVGLQVAEHAHDLRAFSMSLRSDSGVSLGA